jgi:hypothetical protein
MKNIWLLIIHAVKFDKQPEQRCRFSLFEILCI